MNPDWNRSAITVYSPDTILSGLAPALDTFIRNTTGLQQEVAFLAIHDESSIDHFYQLQERNAPQAALVRDLFVARPLIVTIWRGRDSLPRLQKIKGATQPALAAPGSIRSLFWCDNPVCNLIHVSDDVDDMERDFGILLDRRIAGLRPYSAPYGNCLPCAGLARHNALIEFRRVLSRSHMVPAGRPLHVSLPQDGNASRTASTLIAELLEDAQSGSAATQVLVRHFLFAHPDFSAAATKYLGPCSAWERLVIYCGIASNRLWVDRLSHGGPVKAVPACFMESTHV